MTDDRTRKLIEKLKEQGIQPSSMIDVEVQHCEMAQVVSWEQFFEKKGKISGEVSQYKISNIPLDDEEKTFLGLHGVRFTE